MNHSLLNEANVRAQSSNKCQMTKCKSSGFNRQVPRPAKAGYAGSLPTGRQEGAQSIRYFLCSLPARHYVPGKPRPVAGELHIWALDFIWH